MEKYWSTLYHLCLLPDFIKTKSKHLIALLQDAILCLQQVLTNVGFLSFHEKWDIKNNVVLNDHISNGCSQVLEKDISGLLNRLENFKMCIYQNRKIIYNCMFSKAYALRKGRSRVQSQEEASPKFNQVECKVRPALVTYALGPSLVTHTALCTFPCGDRGSTEILILCLLPEINYPLSLTQSPHHLWSCRRLSS